MTMQCVLLRGGGVGGFTGKTYCPGGYESSAKPNLITWVAFFAQNQDVLLSLMIKINSKIDIC